MAFRTEDVETAKCDDFVALGLALLGELIVNRFPLILRNLENFPFVLEEHHRGGGDRVCSIGRLCADYCRRLRIRHRELVLEEMFARQKFRVAAEKNVRTTASHV